MKNFLAVYLGSPTGPGMDKWKSMNEAERKEREVTGFKAWTKWMEDNKKSVVTSGGPVGKTKRADRDGIKDAKNNLTGFIVVQAESHEAAAKLFANHPHFSIFPGEGIEIMECLPIPTM